MSPDQLSTRQQQWGHTMKTDIYIDVTNRVIAAMTSAGTDWTAPFRQTSDGVARSVDGHVYTGINALLLGLLGGGVWGTYKSWQKHGAWRESQQPQ